MNGTITRTTCTILQPAYYQIPEYLPPLEEIHQQDQDVIRCMDETILQDPKNKQLLENSVFLQTFGELCHGETRAIQLERMIWGEYLDHMKIIDTLIPDMPAQYRLPTILNRIEKIKRLKMN